ncbi:hypothetical protein Hypma_007444 [Hypsizygus marmoreus]|uniref:Uncharacterized protein n=1 Tax=Hypsizygus marmoreus TaxID=39966 RepID=A0A369JRR5_HYPMA|nr:hypothetical protein Hypma_007444 [Hypsizygus marmoreus]
MDHSSLEDEGINTLPLLVFRTSVNAASCWTTNERRMDMAFRFSGSSCAQEQADGLGEVEERCPMIWADMNVFPKPAGPRIQRHDETSCPSALLDPRLEGRFQQNPLAGSFERSFRASNSSSTKVVNFNHAIS